MGDIIHIPSRAEVVHLPLYRLSDTQAAEQLQMRSHEPICDTIASHFPAAALGFAAGILAVVVPAIIVAGVVR
jgi:hypothetical protein